MSGLLHLGIMGNDPLRRVGEVHRMSCTDLALEQQHRAGVDLATLVVMAMSLTSPVVAVLVNNTLSPDAVPEEKPLNVPVVSAAVTAALATKLANAVATVAAVAPPAGAV